MSELRIMCKLKIVQKELLLMMTAHRQAKQYKKKIQLFDDPEEGLNTRVIRVFNSLKISIPLSDYKTVFG